MPKLTAWLLVTSALGAQPLPADAAPEAVRADENERDTREKLPQIVEALALKHGSVVADIGAGYGYYAVRFSQAVGPAGRVYAQEIDGPLFERLRKRIASEKLKNVQAILGKPGEPGLPASSLDAALVADVYHEVDNQVGFLKAIRPLLKPAGLLMIIEYLKPEMSTESRDRQRKEHNIAPKFVEQDLVEAGFAVIGRQEPFGPGYDKIPTYYLLAVAKPN